MISLSVSEIETAAKGILIRGNPASMVRGVSIDSRTIETGDVFIPLRGETDGHRYIDDAIGRGAVGVIVEKDHSWTGNSTLKNADGFVVEVGDTLEALQSIAGYYRKKLQLKVVAVTGSAGKTTTKDMINCVLSQKYRVVSTDKNYNNEIGVPLTVFRADQNTEVLVIEMAMRGRGQIKELAEIVKPDIGVITNIGQAHIELLGSEQAIAETKAELVEALSEEGVAVLNADDLWAPFVSKTAISKIANYGIISGDVRAEKIEVDELGCTKFRLVARGGDVYTVRLSVPGKHNIYNALAAAAVAFELGLSADQVRSGLSNCKLSEMRMDVFSGANNVLILNDAYNANPAAMRAALATLVDVKVKGRHIAVLGDMLELGKHASEAHKSIGVVVAELGVDVLIAVGDESQTMAESAVRSGMNPKTVIVCADANSAVQVLKQLIKAEDVVLVKASRAVRLEVVVKALVET